MTAITPTLASGTGLRTYGVTAALARHGHVEIAYVACGSARARRPSTSGSANVGMRALDASRGLRRALEYARARARGVPGGLARGVSPALLAAARAAPAGVRVIADGPVVAAALLPLARRREVVYLAHNLESGRFRDASGARPSRAVRAGGAARVLRVLDGDAGRRARGQGAGGRAHRDAVRAERGGRRRGYGRSSVGTAGCCSSATSPTRRTRGAALPDRRGAPGGVGALPDARLTAVGRGLREAPRDPGSRRRGSSRTWRRVRRGGRRASCRCCAAGARRSSSSRDSPTGCRWWQRPRRAPDRGWRAGTGLHRRRRRGRVRRGDRRATGRSRARRRDRGRWARARGALLLGRRPG